MSSFSERYLLGVFLAVSLFVGSLVMATVDPARASGSALADDVLRIPVTEALPDRRAPRERPRFSTPHLDRLLAMDEGRLVMVFFSDSPGIVTRGNDLDFDVASMKLCIYGIDWQLARAFFAANGFPQTALLDQTRQPVGDEPTPENLASLARRVVEGDCIAFVPRDWLLHGAVGDEPLRRFFESGAAVADASSMRDLARFAEKRNEDVHVRFSELVETDGYLLFQFQAAGSHGHKLCYVAGEEGHAALSHMFRTMIAPRLDQTREFRDGALRPDFTTMVRGRFVHEEMPSLEALFDRVQKQIVTRSTRNGCNYALVRGRSIARLINALEQALPMRYGEWTFHAQPGFSFSVADARATLADSERILESQEQARRRRLEAERQAAANVRRIEDRAGTLGAQCASGRHILGVALVMADNYVPIETAQTLILRLPNNRDLRGFVLGSIMVGYANTFRMRDRMQDGSWSNDCIVALGGRRID